MQAQHPHRRRPVWSRPRGVSGWTPKQPGSMLGFAMRQHRRHFDRVGCATVGSAVPRSIPAQAHTSFRRSSSTARTRVAPPGEPPSHCASSAAHGTRQTGPPSPPRSSPAAPLRTPQRPTPDCRWPVPRGPLLCVPQTTAIPTTWHCGPAGTCGMRPRARRRCRWGSAQPPSHSASCVRLCAQGHPNVCRRVCWPHNSSRPTPHARRRPCSWKTQEATRS